MRPSDFIRTGIINLSRRRVRTSLTALSMAIGVMCILMLVSVGIGYEQAYRESIEAMGSLTKIDVTQKNGSNGKIAILNKKAVAAFKGIDGVEAVTPVLQSTAYLKSGKYITMVKLYGIDMDTAASFGITPIEGELPKKGTRLMPELMATDDLAASFAEPDTWKEAVDRNGKPLIDLMRANVKMTFDYASLVGDYTEGEDGRAVPLGQSLRASVTGICSAMNYTYSCSAFLHMDTLKAIAGNSNAAADKNAAEYPLVWVKVSNADDVMEIASLIRNAGFETYSLTDMLESVKEQTARIQGLLFAIGAVALLVAGLCIANTMMMAINERRTEVGILKVLGSELRDIAAMFLTEAAMIGLLGGLVGIGLSFALRAALNGMLSEMDVRSVMPVWLAGFALAFSVVIAVISALIPAMNAMRISPLCAMRDE